MNQTQKRLSIIKLAISITDIETIQLQILKLSPIKTDNKIQEILSLLQAGNYAQAQGLIGSYIDAAPVEILQRTSQQIQHNITKEEQSIIDKFNLFVTPFVPETKTSSETKVMQVDINDYESIPTKITKEKYTVNYDDLLNLEAGDILSDNIDIDISNTKIEKDSFFKEEEELSSKPTDTTVSKDTFFDESEEISKKEDNTKASRYKELDLGENPLIEEKSNEEDIFSTEITEENTPLSYQAMPHISQKFISMKSRYPLIQTSYESFDTVELWLTKISQDGYTEIEIEEMITDIKKLIEKEQYTQAAQLLLVCGSTESKFAQFMLARELFTGSILTRNIPEAFTLMNTLAIDDYPEALCDLGQFYENGIGTTPNLMKAEGLYKEALNLGIKRAKKHHTRLKKLNRGFFKN